MCLNHARYSYFLFFFTYIVKSCMLAEFKYIILNLRRLLKAYTEFSKWKLSHIYFSWQNIAQLRWDRGHLFITLVSRVGVFVMMLQRRQKSLWSELSVFWVRDFCFGGIYGQRQFVYTNLITTCRQTCRARRHVRHCHVALYTTD